MEQELPLPISLRGKLGSARIRKLMFYKDYF